MSTREVSSIKPKIDGKAPTHDEGIKFKYLTAAYDSFIKEGFIPPEPQYRSDKRERQFLSQVDVSKRKIKVKITRMYRLKAVDYSNENEESKEYLYWESNWYAKNYLGAEINPVIGHIEGKYKEQTKKLVSGMDPNTGRITADYIKDIPREVYSITFSKTEVDKLLKGEHPFGPDSVNITDLSKVVFYRKLEGILGVMNFRCADYTYEQFIVPEWKKFAELATKRGGPANRAYYEDTGQFIT